MLSAPLRLRRPMQVLCLLAALAAIPHFWLDAKAERGDPALLAFSRMELSYFVALAQTASELPPATVTREEAAEHGPAYPKLPLYLHAAAWRWGGLPGLVAADVLVTTLAYCLWCAVYRLLTRRPAWALLCGAATINGTAGALMGWLRSVVARLFLSSPPVSKALGLAVVGGAIVAALWQMRRATKWRPVWRVALLFVLAVWIAYLKYDGGFWSLRFPRPFVTSLFSTLWLLALLMMWRLPRRRLPDFTAGLMAGLTLQSDLYSFASLGLVTLAVWIIRRRFSIRALVAFGVPFGLAIAPFVLKQLGVQPEMRLRMGLVHLPRAAFARIAAEVSGPYPLLAFAVVAVLAACLLCRAGRRHPLWLVAILTLATAFSPAILVGVAGQAAQFWHYNYLVPMAFAFFAWAALTTGAGELLPRRGAKSDRRLAWIAPVVCGGAAMLLPSEGSAFGGEVHFPRREFAEVARELRQPRYAGDRILGTWLPEVRTWWLSLHRTALNPDPFASNLPEPELERRLLRLAQLQEMTREDFTKQLRQAGEVPTAYWHLGHYKYYLWRWSSLEPPDHYAHYEEYGFLLPDATVERLAAAYPALAAPLPCDLIVRRTPEVRPEIPPTGYAVTFRNVYYQVLQRK